jgi:hypothetical protein
MGPVGEKLDQHKHSPKALSNLFSGYVKLSWRRRWDGEVGLTVTANMRCKLHTTLMPTPIVNATVTLNYTPTPTCNPTLIDTPITSFTVDRTLTRTLTLNFITTTPQPIPQPQAYLQPIPPALVLFQSRLDTYHNQKLILNPMHVQSQLLRRNGIRRIGG